VASGRKYNSSMTQVCEVLLNVISYHSYIILLTTASGGLWTTRRPASADRTASRQFQATGQPVSWTQASDAMTSRLLRRAKVCATQVLPMRVGPLLCIQISRERSYPLPISWYHSKGNWLRYNSAAESFYIMKLCSRLFVLYCRNCPKDDKFR